MRTEIIQQFNKQFEQMIEYKYTANKTTLTEVNKMADITKNIKWK